MDMFFRTATITLVFVLSVASGLAGLALTSGVFVW
jgi:hypothetical protein